MAAAKPGSAIEKGPLGPSSALPHADGAFLELFHHLFENVDFLGRLFRFELGDARDPWADAPNHDAFGACLCGLS